MNTYNIEYEIPPLRAIYNTEADGDSADAVLEATMELNPSWRIRKIIPKKKEQPGWYDHGTYIEIKGTSCEITLEKRPPYCDRGNWIAKLHARHPLSMDIDEQDGWPRYFFDEQRAKLEIEAWLTKRGQM